MRILVVDDEPLLLETVSHRLTRDGYKVLTSQTAEDALKKIRSQRPDLVILDVMLPGRSGFELSRTIREESNIPILFLSARAGSEDRLKGFEVGGDDYLTKPFNLSELSARVRAILKRAKVFTEKKRIESGGLIIDSERQEVICNGKKLELRPKEYALLLFLASNPGRVFTRKELLSRVWGENMFVTTRTVDVHVSWLRKRLEKEAGSPQRIFTVRNAGYKFE